MLYQVLMVERFEVAREMATGVRSWLLEPLTRLRLEKVEAGRRARSSSMAWLLQVLVLGAVDDTSSKMTCVVTV